jgi:hypothetical protein
MISFWKQASRYTTTALCICLLATTLVACDDSGGTTSTPPTPTPIVTYQTYQGTGFTLDYPSTWGVHASGDQVTFADPLGKNVLAIFADPDLAGEPDAEVVGSQTITHLKSTLLANAQDMNIPQTFNTSEGRVTWLQFGASGTMANLNPGTQGILFLLVTNFPPQSKKTVTYQIEYYGPASTFGQANVLFMHMLQSFAFTTQ